MGLVVQLHETGEYTSIVDTKWLAYMSLISW